MTNDLEWISKTTRFERWLATRVRFFARRWQRRVERDLFAASAGRLANAKQRVVYCARDYVREQCVKAELVDAVCEYQNAVAEWKRLGEKRTIGGR